MSQIKIVVLAAMVIGVPQLSGLASAQNQAPRNARRIAKPASTRVREMDRKIDSFLKTLKKPQVQELESMLHNFTKASKRGQNAQDVQVQKISKAFPAIKDLAGLSKDPLAKGGKGWKKFVGWLKRIVHKCTTD